MPRTMPFDHVKIIPFTMEKAEPVAPDATGRRRLTVQGWLSVEEVDLDNEIIEPTFFADSLPAFMRNPQMWWEHREPQGLWEDVQIIPGRGMFVRGTMVDLGGHEDARRMAMVEERIVRSLSVGFNLAHLPGGEVWGDRSQYGLTDDAGVFHWQRGGILMEGSLVPIPACPGASMTLGKSLGLRQLSPELTKAVCPYKAWPVAPEEQAWDGAQARRDIADWAGGGTDLAEMDWGRYKTAFCWQEPDKAEQVGGYKFPVCMSVDGGLKLVWRGLAASAARIPGADIPEADKADILDLLKRYYKLFDKPFPENLTATVTAAKDVDWRNDEQGIAEEIRAEEDMERLRTASVSLANITRHWVSQDGAPSALLVGAAVSTMAELASIAKEGRVLSASNRSAVDTAVEALQELQRRDDESRAPREATPCEHNAEAPDMLRFVVPESAVLTVR